MLLVILGAGASFDSIDSRLVPLAGRMRPPLARDLFAANDETKEVLNRFPECRPIVPDLRRAVGRGESVEATLQGFVDEAEQYTTRRRHLAAAQFYLQDLLFSSSKEWPPSHGGVTNYVTLVDRIERWRALHGQAVAYVTFNYDTLLEQACADVYGFSPKSVDDYIADETRPIFKLHGSVNWGRWVGPEFPVRGEDGALNPVRTMHRLIEAAGTYTFLDRFELMGSPQDVVPQGDAGVLAPVIAVPVQKKTTFVCPASHADLLERLVPTASRVLIIGWRATEETLLAMLADSLPEDPVIELVTSRQASADEVSANLSNAGVTGRVSAHIEGFSGFLGSDDIVRFLPRRRGRRRLAS